MYGAGLPIEAMNSRVGVVIDCMLGIVTCFAGAGMDRVRL